MLVVHIAIVAFNSKEYLDALALRFEVLRKPLGLEYSTADLLQEKDDIHFVAMIDDNIVGCLLLRPLSISSVKMRQVAIDIAHQKKGIGQKLVLASENYVRSLGDAQIELSARETAVPFYSKLGYQIVGEPYAEIGIPHQKMEKRLIP